VLGVVLAGCTYTPAPNTTPADATDAADPSIDGPGSDGLGACAPVAGVVEAECFASKTETTYAWSPTTTLSGFSGTSYMQCGPGTGGVCSDPAMLPSCAASLVYDFDLTAGGDHHVHVRQLSITGSGGDNSIWYQLDATPPVAMAFTADSTWEWDTDGPITLASGAHVLTIWQRECGARVDVVALTTSDTPP